MTDETTPDAPVDEASAATATENGEADKPKKLKQTVEMQDIGPCKKHIKVIVERGDIDERLNEKFAELMKGATVPGFRPGKAPRKVVTRRYEKDVIAEVKGQVLLASLE